MKQFHIMILLVLMTLSSRSQTFFKLGAAMTNHSKVWIEGELGQQLKGNNMVSASVFTNMTRNIWVAKYGTHVFKRVTGHVGLALQDQKVSPYVGAAYTFNKRYHVGLAWTDRTKFFTIGVKFRK